MKHKGKIAAVLATVGICFVPVMLSDSKVETEPTLEFSPLPQDEQIILDGLSQMTFQAGEIKQNVDFQNKNENCRIKVSIALSDGTTIYESALLNPKEELKEIELSNTLERGIYSNCVLQYECFSLNGGALNSANFKITLFSV